MKNKKSIILSFIFSIALLSGQCFAEMRIQGNAYGDKIGIIHFDYTSSIMPDEEDFSDSKYYLGINKQFYLDPTDPNAKKIGELGYSAHIKTTKGDGCTDNDFNSYCLLGGYMWNDKIGWITLNGKNIDDALPQNINGIDPYTEEGHYPKIWRGTGNNQGAITGLAWNPNIGWINLSSDSTGTKTKPNDQDQNDWGVFLDYDKSIMNIDPGGLGYRLYGYAWSKNVGWIKFSSITGEEPAFGAFSFWEPTLTPPTLLGADMIWFEVGKNTDSTTTPEEYANALGAKKAIRWKMGIQVTGNLDPSNTNISLSTDTEDTECGSKIKDVTPDIKKVTLGLEQVIEITVDNLADLNGIQKGYCKYYMNAKITDNAGTTYIGSEFCSGADCVSGTPNDPSDIYNPRKTIFVRAGDVDENKTKITLTGDKNIALADGEEQIEYVLELKDIISNPIIPINCSDLCFDQACANKYENCPGRTITVSANIINQLDYNLIKPEGNSPVYYGSDIPVALLPKASSDKTAVVIPSSLVQDYRLKFISYAPSKTYDSINKETKDYKLKITDYSIEVKNDPLPDPQLPGHNTTSAPYNYNPDTPQLFAIHNQQTENNIPDNALKLSWLPMEFTAPLKTVNASIAGKTPEESSLRIGEETSISFDITNISSLALADNDSGISIDTVFAYEIPEGTIKTPEMEAAMASMETHRISSDNNDNDSDYAWSDPFFAGPAHFEMYYGALDISNNISPLFSPFKSAYPLKFDFDIPYSDNSQLNNVLSDVFEDFYTGTPPKIMLTDAPNAGSYPITGQAGIPERKNILLNITEDTPTAFQYEPGFIDRSDKVVIELTALKDEPANTAKKAIKFTPNKFTSAGISDVTLTVSQDIAYRYPGQLLFTKFRQPPLVTGIGLKDILAQASGPVAGAATTTEAEREFEVISGALTVNQLQEQIRRNVIRMTAGIEACDIETISNFNTLTQSIEFKTKNCGIYDSADNSIFVYYEGDQEETLLIGSGSDMELPKKKFTIIVKGGSNIFIKDNIFYPTNLGPNEVSSFGIIVIADEIGKGANVFIEPDVTNLVGALYAEGSVLSMDTNNDFYYGGGDADTYDLKNQLYWNGSIASRNTIGGAALKIFPEGAQCLEGDTDTECAQRYDFDYLRRFEIADNGVPRNDGKFSGGGTCPDAENGHECICTLCKPDCNFNFINDTNHTCAGETNNSDQQKLPSVISLTIDKKIDRSFITVNEQQIYVSQTAPFYVKKHEGTVNNPPPGFTIVGGMETIREVR